MSRKFQVKIIPSKWIEDGGHRLDCGPYLSGAMEAKELLRAFDNDLLKDVVIPGGIFHAGRESRMWVETAEYGTPFLGSTDILTTNLVNLPFISNKQLKSNPNLVLHEGWSLITRSGTIGRMAYCRSDLDGLACSEHAMRVVPDDEKIKSGYLYAFLSSRFGVPIVVSGTYGSIIQSIEPQHLADLPVPRLGAVEEKAHELVQRAADLRVEATALLKGCGEALNQTLGFPNRMSLSHRSFSCTLANASQMVARMEATYYDAVSLKTDEMIATLPNKDLFSALDISIDETGRLKQIFVDEEYGVPFLTSGEIFQLSYAPTRFLSKRLLPMDEAWAMDEGDILLARSGQVGGIIGRGVWADRRFAGGCVSVDVLRIKTEKARIPAGYLYTYLCLTDVGYHQLIRTAAGSSIPHISASDVYKLWIPRCPDEIEKRIDVSVRKAGFLRADAQDYEDQARALVEQAIEEGGQ